LFEGGATTSVSSPLFDGGATALSTWPVEVAVFKDFASFPTNNTKSKRRLEAPPSNNGNLFSTYCSNPSVSGFILYAYCGENGDWDNDQVSFTSCIRNYYGYLQGFNGSYNELYTRNCYTDGYNLICQCQQPNDSDDYETCSVPLNNYFFWNNGDLTC